MAQTVGSLVLLSVLLAGCGAAQQSAPSSDNTGGVDREVMALPTDGQADYQLGGPYDPAENVTVLVRDSTAPPAPGLYNICYVNGFQSQPQDADFWTEQHPDLLLPDSGSGDGDGSGFLIDPNWPDEYLFDTSTPEQRDAVAEIIGQTIQRCADAGYDAVEIDNLDSWTRARLDTMTKATNLDLAARYVQLAHAAGLAIGQKSSAEVGSSGAKIGFDFAVAEECHRWDECASYTDVYGDQVLDIEYADDLRGTFEDVCRDPQTPRMTILRDRYLVPDDEPAHIYEACPLS